MLTFNLKIKVRGSPLTIPCQHQTSLLGLRSHHEAPKDPYDPLRAFELTLEEGIQKYVGDMLNLLANTFALLDDELDITYLYISFTIYINCKFIRVALLHHHPPISRDDQSSFASCHQMPGFV